MKKRLSVLFSLLFALLFAVSSLAGALGDVDNDGGVTAGDARVALRIAVGLEEAPYGSPRFLAADADKDGSVTAGDARLILRAAVGLETLEADEPEPEPEPGPAGDALTRKQVYDLASKFTVEITSEVDEGVVLGSGFFISKDGRLLTNYHVVADTKELSVKDYNGNVYEVERVLAVDRNIDMALLQVKGDVPAWATLNKKDYSTADTVYALGSSAGYTGSFSEGMISTAERKLEDYSDVVYIQHTAAISQGNSGGPLLDDRGRVIGINTLGDDQGNSLYFAVPVSYLDELDLSAPMNVEEFSEAERNYKAIDFLGEHSENNLMPPHAAGIFMIAVTSKDDVSVEAGCDSDALEVRLNNAFDVYYSIVVVAKKECENVPVTIFLKEAPEVSVSLNFTVSSDAPKFGCGLLKDIPDYGAIIGISPTVTRLTGADTFPSLVYRDRSVFASRSADDLHGAYEAALTDAGFTLSDSQSVLLNSITNYTYVNAKAGVGLNCIEERLLNRMRSVTLNFG